MSDRYSVPELTRGLRAFAAPSAFGDLHDRIFGPLVDARRAASRATDWQGRVAAFDAARLDATLRMVILTIAQERHATSPPDRRALAAQLEDAFAPMFVAIGSLGQAALRVQDARDEISRTEAWARWVDAVRTVFAAADLGWETSDKILTRDEAATWQRSRQGDAR